MKCGKQFTLDLRIRDFNNGKHRKTCSNKCGKSHVLSEESRLKQSLASKKKRLHTCPKCGKQFMNAGTGITRVLCKDCKGKVRSKNIGLHKINCKQCNKEIYVKAEAAKYCYECCQQLNKKPYQLFYSDGKKLISEKTCKKLSQSTKRLMAQGKIKPWQSRNIKSYAQKFFHKVLQLNHIPYISQKYQSGYFLDFVIQTQRGLIDLQIDGKQHWNQVQRIQHDKIRDKRLKQLGYDVYRIPWNSLNTQAGKLLMKQKIQEFLKYVKV